MAHLLETFSEIFYKHSFNGAFSQKVDLEIRYQKGDEALWAFVPDKYFSWYDCEYLAKLITKALDKYNCLMLVLSTTDSDDYRLINEEVKKLIQNTMGENVIIEGQLIDDYDSYIFSKKVSAKIICDKNDESSVQIAEILKEENVKIGEVYKGWFNPTKKTFVFISPKDNKTHCWVHLGKNCVEAKDRLYLIPKF